MHDLLSYIICLYNQYSALKNMILSERLAIMEQKKSLAGPAEEYCYRRNDGEAWRQHFDCLDLDVSCIGPLIAGRTIRDNRSAGF